MKDTALEWTQEELGQLLESKGYTPHFYWAAGHIPQGVKFLFSDPPNLEKAQLFWAGTHPILLTSIAQRFAKRPKG